MNAIRHWIFVVLCLAAPTAFAGDGAVFGDGFEPPCNGTANDLPGCIVVPFGQAPLTPFLQITAAAAWNRVDAYVLLDRSASMATETQAVRTNMASVLNAVRCPPDGIGSPSQCFPDLWTGAGAFAYAASTSGDPYRHAADVQPNPNFASVPSNDPPGCCNEVTLFGLMSSVTGQGTALFPTCGIQPVSSRTTCVGSPAGEDGTGYACFRPDAATLVVLVTDEAPSLNTNCPAWTTVVRPAFQARDARIVTVYGDGTTAGAVNEFATFAQDTGAVNAAAGNQPLVLLGGGASASQAVELVLQSFRANAPLDVSVEIVDDPADAIDVTAFVDRIETFGDGTPQCTSGLPVEDFDGDGTPDTFDLIRAGTAVCFRIVPASNTTVAATNEVQIFGATLRVLGDHRVPISTQRIWFAVPRN